MVEDEALRSLVREGADERLVRPENKLPDRLDGLRAPGLDVDERKAIFETRDGHNASNVALTDIDEIGDAWLICDVHIGKVGADAQERGEHLAPGINDRGFPIPLGGSSGVGIW